MLGLSSSVVSGGCLDSSVVAFYNTTTNTNSMEFDGAGDYLFLSDHEDFSFDGGVPFSVAAWVKRDVTNKGQGFFSKGQIGARLSNQEYRVFWHTDGKLYVDISDGGGYQSSGAYRRITFADNSTDWQHYVITSDGTDGESLSGHIKLYVNGTSVSQAGAGNSDTDGMQDTNTVFSIARVGGEYSSNSKDFDGNICQFMMWRNKELSQDEVTYLYASGAAHRNPTQNAGDYVSSSNLLLWLPLQSNANDISGNGHSMNILGGASTEADVPF